MACNATVLQKYYCDYSNDTMTCDPIFLKNIPEWVAGVPGYASGVITGLNSFKIFLIIFIDKCNYEYNMNYRASTIASFTRFTCNKSILNVPTLALIR